MVKLTQGRVTQSRNPKVEPKAKAVSVEGVAQQGAATAFNKPNLMEGRGYEPGPMPATGVKGKYNSAATGPGSGRTVYGSGSQSQYGAPAPGSMASAPDVPATEPTKDTLAEYGPERRRR